MPVEVVSMMGGVVDRQVVAASRALSKNDGLRVMEASKTRQKRQGSGGRTPRFEAAAPHAARSCTPSSLAGDDVSPDQSSLPSYMRQTAASMNKRRGPEIQPFTSFRTSDRGSFGEGAGRTTPASVSFGGSSDKSLPNEVVGQGIIPKGYEPGRPSPLKTRNSAPVTNGRRSTTPQGKSSPEGDKCGKSSPPSSVQKGGKSTSPIPPIDHKTGENSVGLHAASKKLQPEPAEVLVITDAVMDLDKNSPTIAVELPENARDCMEPVVKKAPGRSFTRSLKQKILSCMSPGQSRVNYD